MVTCVRVASLSLSLSVSLSLPLSLSLSLCVCVCVRERPRVASQAENPLCLVGGKQLHLHDVEITSPASPSVRLPRGLEGSSGFK
jgi:hypothetical protein